MSSVESSGEGRGKDSSSSKPRKRMRDDCVPNRFSSDLGGVVDALMKIRENALSHEKKEKTIRCVTSELRAIIDDVKPKFEKERRGFAKALLENFEQCESSVKSDFATFQASYEKFHHDALSIFEVQKEKFLAQHEQHRKREKAAFAEFEKACAAKITAPGESMKEMQ